MKGSLISHGTQIEEEARGIEVQEEKKEEYPLKGLYVIKNVTLPIHQGFFPGKIIEQNGKYLTVKFKEEEIGYEYPQCFIGDMMEKGGLRFADPNLQQALERGTLIFKEHSVKLQVLPTPPEPSTPPAVPAPPTAPTPPAVPAPPDFTQISLDEALEKIANAATPDWVTSTTPGNMTEDKKLIWGKHYGTRGRDIYLRGCDVFGWDPMLAGHFSMMKDMYAYCGAPNGKSIWMLPRHVGVLPLAAKAQSQWWNTFSGDLVFEEWREPLNVFYTDWTLRITFAKTNGNGYAFIGVYKPEQIIKELGKDGDMHYIKIYRRIGNDYEA